MRMRTKIAAAGGGLALALGAAMVVPGLGLIAADHNDPPARTDATVTNTPDKAADIADLYAWHTADKVNLVLTFGGPSATTLPAFYDPNVLYTINISNAAPATTAEMTILIRFGPGSQPGQFGVQVSGVPGTSSAIVGSVQSTISQDGVLVHAGLFDDPFFFDGQGLRETRMTGTLSFDNQRDAFGGQNITAVVISIPRERIANGTNQIDLWSTSLRLGGQTL